MPPSYQVRLLTNWGSKLTVVFALAAFAYDMASQFFSVPPIPDSKKLSLLLLLVSTYIVDAGVRWSYHQPLVKFRGRVRRFVEILEAQAEAIRRGIDAELVKIDGRREVVGVLVELCDSVKDCYLGLNFYPHGWPGELRDLFDANIRALKRHATVRRYFVVMDGLRGTSAFDELVAVMKNQSDAGIDVRFSIEADLRRCPDFKAQFLRGGSSLYDDAILCYDVHSGAGGPDELEITWEQARMDERNPFPFLEQERAAVKKFPDDRAYLDQWNAPTRAASTSAAHPAPSSIEPQGSMAGQDGVEVVG